MKEAASLPPGFRSYVGPQNGLPANSFVVFQAGPDGYKTTFLLATALFRMYSIWPLTLRRSSCAHFSSSFQSLGLILRRNALRDTTDPWA